MSRQYPLLQKAWYQRNKEKIKQKSLKDYYKNRDERIEYQRGYYQQNKDYHKKWTAEYYQKHPEITLKSKMKYFKKIGKLFDLDSEHYHEAIKSWSKSIKSRDKKCTICGNETENAHHLLYIRFNPQLSLNLNNGIGLCLKCHNEVHGKNLRKGKK